MKKSVLAAALSLSFLSGGSAFAAPDADNEPLNAQTLRQGTLNSLADLALSAQLAE